MVLGDVAGDKGAYSSSMTIGNIRSSLVNVPRRLAVLSSALFMSSDQEAFFCWTGIIINTLCDACVTD
jgi:hypothetical protein